MIKIITDDKIEKLEVEAIVEPSNTIATENKGASSIIRTLAGKEMIDECKELLNKKYFEEGSFYITKSGNLNIKHIFHAIICRYANSFSSYEYVTKSMRNILKKAVDMKIKSIAFPDLGSFLGLDKDSVARIMVQTARNYCENIEVILFSSDLQFIEYLNKHMI